MVARGKYGLTKAPATDPGGAKQDHGSFDWTRHPIPLLSYSTLELEMAAVC